MLETTSKFKLIAFDLDGTLVDSAPDLALSINLALADFKIPPINENLVNSWIGNGIVTMLQRVLNYLNIKFSDSDFDNLLNKFKKYYAKNYCVKSRLYPNVTETIQNLYKNGFTLALITNKANQYIKPILEHFNLFNYFSDLIGDGDLPELKPHPSSIYFLTEKYNILPEQILFVGDSKNDVLLAKNSGCLVVGLTYGYNYNQPIEESKPNWVSDDITDVLKITKS